MYGALELFKKAGTPEKFEEAVNADGNEINNLDLDGDGKADYVRVIEKKGSDVYTLVLQVSVSASEIQNVAVIEVEKTGNDKASVKIVGDEGLYEKNNIIQSGDETEIIAAETTVTDAGIDESDDDVYSTSDKSASTSLDLEAIEPVVTKVGYYVGYHVVHTMGLSLKISCILC